MECMICHLIMDPDETSIYDVIDEIGGHITCMRDYYEQKGQQ